MLERFADDGREVVALAAKEARSLNHDRVGSEHILLGLTRSENPLATRRLRGCLELDLDALHVLVLRAVDRGPERLLRSRLDFTSDVREMFELALITALRDGREIGGDHLLVALVRNRGSRAATILRDVGVDLERIRLWDTGSPDTQTLTAICNAQKRVEEALRVLRMSLDELGELGHINSRSLTTGNGHLRRLEDWAFQSRDRPA